MKQGVRVEFVCGMRAISTARKDFDALTSAASLFSSHIYDVPAQIRKAIDEAKAAGKREFKLQEELAEFAAVQMVVEAPVRSGLRVVRKRFDDRDVHVFEVTPRKKREDLFKGEIWIDSHTYLKVQESGYLVKSPSIFLKKVAFIRKYEIRDGIAVPLKVLSVADVRFVGKAELTIDFTNFSIDPEKRAAAWDAGQ